MVLPRPTVFRAFAPARLFRNAPRTANRAVARRGYASGHGEHSAPSSDAPWAIGAVAVTIPTCWYLWPSESSHHDAPHVETKHERAEKLTHEADAEEPVEEEERPTPESKGSTDDVQFKGKSAAGDEDNKVGDTRKVEDDHKGAKKLRIDSAAAKDLGAGETHGEDGSETAVTNKDISKAEEGDISQKQKGLSTTATKHSTDITQDPEKSKKGEGVPETAKAQGTVRSDRPHTELAKSEDKSEEKPEDKKDEKKDE
ncbi:hypothetical protein BDV97DRAFT_38648 [Delphinella strobiligena]|nr:hypothetical protein BDV97DRAFT_38648 [Delphinella strobiligena]